MGCDLAPKRKAARYTQREIASRLGVSQQAVSLWERGLAAPSKASHRRALERLFGIDRHSWPKPDGGALQHRRDRLERGACIDCEDPTEGFSRCEMCRMMRQT